MQGLVAHRNWVGVVGWGICRGEKHSIHISTSPHAELCRGSKFFYDVIKMASKWLPPESQLEDKKAKI